MWTIDCLFLLLSRLALAPWGFSRGHLVAVLVGSNYCRVQSVGYYWKREKALPIKGSA
jgi:hypothetical protein